MSNFLLRSDYRSTEENMNKTLIISLLVALLMGSTTMVEGTRSIRVSMTLIQTLPADGCLSSIPVEYFREGVSGDEEEYAYFSYQVKGRLRYHKYPRICRNLRFLALAKCKYLRILAIAHRIIC